MKFEPFAQLGKVFETWQELTVDSLARTAAFYSEMEKLEAKSIERAESAIHEVAKLTKESLAYNAQLGNEWRKLSLDALTRASSTLAATADTAR